jgi:hypothetical protein
MPARAKDGTCLAKLVMPTVPSCRAANPSHPQISVAKVMAKCQLALAA